MNPTTRRPSKLTGRSLHPALIEEGFPQIPRRAFQRPVPLYPHRAIQWRHRFKSECRDAWLPDEVKNPLLGYDDALPGRSACTKPGEPGSRLGATGGLRDGRLTAHTLYHVAPALGIGAGSIGQPQGVAGDHDDVVDPQTAARHHYLPARIRVLVVIGVEVDPRRDAIYPFGADPR
jgi:hypothetical protein